MILNFFAGQYLNYVENKLKRKVLYITFLLLNLSVLLYYKYTNFIVDNVNLFISNDIIIDKIALPLAISFFTFQKFAYITDSYRGETKGYKFLDFCLFVAFFPQLIAGPIVHHKVIMPQFQDKNNLKLNLENVTKGSYMFLMGLFKKIVIADTFALMANAGYANVPELTFLDSWLTSLSYTVQLYFDFSGYSDMAIGVGLIFNIHLPLNFNSPYKSNNIQDFWRRWHITLGNFLREYIYIPLGGNQKGEYQTLFNLFVTFLVGGIWHGANWNFLIWGALHGLALVIHRVWIKRGYFLPNILSWILTFFFVNFTWVFFRALTFNDAIIVLKCMLGGTGGVRNGSVVFTDIFTLPVVVLGVILLFLKNPQELTKEFKPNIPHLIYMVVLALISTLYLNSITSSDFLYFDF
ncbi:MBOAT family protein [Flectobacillus sp. BAB-3569]|uniref:MBOAT family O-acyltransferase n=1 Tax=Flectobacillus sp. BAB-3569 TaxID=1509483 RepID=UPI001E4FCDB3|nr:MBOAT family O-acyltransferase [Flectobacillus sp. BAB-3569]